MPKEADGRDLLRATELEIYLGKRFTERSRIGRVAKPDLSEEFRRGEPKKKNGERNCDKAKWSYLTRGTEGENYSRRVIY